MTEQVFVVIQECSEGNESVGSMWLETKVFSHTATLEQAITWAKGKRSAGGKTILTIADNPVDPHDK